jgi:hypothetical protein
MPATLSLARDAFIRVMNRDTDRGERPRLIAVLDAMIAWSAAQPAVLRFRADDNVRGVVRFERVDSGAVFWSASPRVRETPLLELLPGSARLLPDDVRSGAVDTLNANTRATQDMNGRLSIGFGALKNAAARAAVLELMTELLKFSAVAPHRPAARRS